MKRPGRRIVATMLVVVGLGGIVGGCYYPVPAPPPPPGSVFVRGHWVWNGYTWLWQPGYWIAPAPPPGQTAPPPQPMPETPATPEQTPPSTPGAPTPPSTPGAPTP